MSHRTVHDSHGDTWDIWQVDPLIAEESARTAQALAASTPSSPLAAQTPARSAYLDPTLANGWLCFESANERRRLAPIPDGWDRMTEAELRALCMWATVVPRNYGGIRRPQRDESEGNAQRPSG